MTTALGKSVGFFISCCIVGNVEAPPKANRIVPNAKKKVWKSGFE